ncbi:ubiquitin-like protein Pup [Rothia mucilaginosa]
MSRERISAQQTETTAAEQEQELSLAASHVVSDVSEVDDLLDEIDGLLDEIDGLLAENAEDFVTGFVQKGGE